MKHYTVIEKKGENINWDDEIWVNNNWHKLTQGECMNIVSGQAGVSFIAKAESPKPVEGDVRKGAIEIFWNNYDMAKMALLINKIIHDEHPNAKHDIGLRIMDELMKTIAPFITDKPVEGDVRIILQKLISNSKKEWKGLPDTSLAYAAIWKEYRELITEADALLSKYNFTRKG